MIIKMILFAGFVYSVGLVMAAFLVALVGKKNKEQQAYEDRVTAAVAGETQGPTKGDNVRNLHAQRVRHMEEGRS